MVESVKRLWQFGQQVLGIIFRHPVTGVSVVPILPNGEIILVRRRDSGKWAFPGGMVDWGEDIPTALRREVWEETGLEVMENGRLVGVYSAPDRDPRVHSICILVEAPVQGDIQIHDQREIIEVKAFSRESIPKENFSHDYARQMQDYLEGRITLA